MLNITVSVTIVMVWLLMWPLAKAHDRFMERPENQGWGTGLDSDTR